MKVKKTTVNFSQACLTLDSRSYGLGYVAGPTFLRSTRSSRVLKALPGYMRCKDGYFVLQALRSPRPYEDDTATERRRGGNEVLVPAEYVDELFKKKTLERFQRASDRLERESDVSSLTEVDVVLVSLRKFRGKEVCSRLELLLRVSNYHRVQNVFKGVGCDLEGDSTSQLVVREVNDKKDQKIILSFTAATADMLQILKSDSFQELAAQRSALKAGTASGLSLGESDLSVGEPQSARVVLGSDDEDDDDDRQEGETSAKA